MSLILRPYQEDIICRTREAIKSGLRAPLIVSPCGSGKTVMFSYFASRVTEKDKRTLILAHRDELIDQISETLWDFEVLHSFIAAGREYNPLSPVHVASVFSAVRRLERMEPPDVIIIDEAHHSIRGSTWGRVVEAFPNALRIGVTATPQRLSGEGLKDMFDTLIIGPSVQELIALGSLSGYKIYAPSTINTEGLHTRAGDFARGQLAEAADTPTVTGDAIKEYKKHADGKRAIVFCVSINHAKHVSEQFRDAGYSSMSIDGKLGRDDRHNIVQSFRTGATKILTSCDIISEGFDLPAIECAIMLRPTKSLALWIQQSGRALRPYPGKEYAIILDHAGNCMRHGLPDDPRAWTLEGRDKKKSDKSTVRLCPSCLFAQPIFRTSCKDCGFVFLVESRETKHVEGDLTEVDPSVARRTRKSENRKCSTLEDFAELGKARGYKSPKGWAWHMMRLKESRSVYKDTRKNYYFPTRVM